MATTDKTPGILQPEALGYPKLKTIILTLDIQIEDADKDGYIFESPLASGDEGAKLQLGFIADLFDLFNFEASLGVIKINNETPETIKARL